MSGRFGKYGDAKRRAHLRKARRTRAGDQQKVARKRSPKRSRSTTGGDRV